MKTIQDWLCSKDTYATTLATILAHHYGLEFVDWDPTALMTDIEQDFHIHVPQSNADRIHAATVVLGTDMFHRNTETFLTVCNAFSFASIHAEQFTPSDAMACTWGCLETRLLQGEEVYDHSEFHPDIAAYVGFLLDQLRLFEPPSPLTFAVYPTGDPDQTDQALAGDDTLHRLYWERQREEKRFLEEYGIGRLAEVFQQLEQLPIKALDTSLAAKLKQFFQSKVA